MSVKKTFCTSPETGRSIIVGGRTWRKLLREGTISNDNNHQNENVLYTVNEEEYENPEEVKEEVYRQKEKFKLKNTNKNKHPRVYKNKVIMGNNRLTTQEASRLTADAAVKVIDKIQNNEEEIPQNMTRDEAHDFLQGLIFDKMLSNKKKFINSRLEPSPKSNPRRIKIQKPELRRTVSFVNKLGTNFSEKPKKKLKPLKRVPKKKYIPEEEYEEEYEEEDPNQEYEEEYEYVEENINGP